MMKLYSFRVFKCISSSNVFQVKKRDKMAEINHKSVALLHVLLWYKGGVIKVEIT